MSRQRHKGFTIIELMIVIAIIGILAAIAAPSFADMIERNKLKQAVEGLKSDLEWARSESIKQSCNVSIVFTTGANWQYDMSPCTGTAKTVTSTSSAVNMSSTTFTANTVAFDFKRGGAEDAGVIYATTNYQVTVDIDNGRRIRICNPVAGTAVRGYEGC
jgi:prepilin-type N-terminal cleavage/methylation domain-containing protein